MHILFKLIITLFLAGFFMIFFSDCNRRWELICKYLGLLLMTPAVVTAFVSVIVGVWTL